MKAIYKKELNHYLHSPLGYVFIGIFLLISGFFFVSSVPAGTDILLSTFGNLGVAMIFLVSIITMRLVAEEKHSKTDQLLLTTPNSAFAIIFAKFLACCTLFAISMVITLVFPIILVIFGGQSISSCVAIYIGFFLMGVSLISLGLFCSSLTENQVVAAVISFAVMLFILLLSAITNMVSNPIILAIIGWFSVLQRYDTFSSGQMDISALLYFISFTAIFVFLAAIKFDKNFMRKWKIKMPIVLVCIAAIIAINGFFPAVATKFNWNTTFDLSASKIFTLTADSKNVLNNLNEDVKFYYFYQDQDNYPMVSDVLQKYVDASSHITMEKDNITDNPLLSQKFAPDSELQDGDIVVESAKRFKLLSVYDLFNSSDGTNYDIFQGENQLTSAIISVTADKLPNVGIITGHGGSTTDGSNIQQVFADKQYTETDLSTITSDIPSDIDVLMLISPKTDFSLAELDKIDNFIQSGKGLQVYLDTSTPNLPNLQNYLANWGVTFENNVIVETDSQYYYPSNQNYFVTQFDDSPITTTLYDSGLYAVVNTARQTKLTDDYSNDNVTRQALISSSATSYTQDANGNKVDDGPIDLAAIAYKQDASGNPTSSVMFVGSANIIDSDDLFYNENFFTSSIEWQSGIGISLNIPVKSLTSAPLNITAAQFNILQIIVLAVLPLVALITGLVIWLRRRKL